MPGCCLEHLPNSLTGLGTALNVALGTDLLSYSQTLSALNWALVHPFQILFGLAVLAEILLARDEDDGKTLTEVEDLGNPLSKSASP